MDGMNQNQSNNQTDIFGNVTPFPSEPEPLKPDDIIFEPSPMEVPVVQPEVLEIPEEVEINTTPSEPTEEIVAPTESFTEMPFSGVNQQMEEEKPIISQNQYTNIESETRMNSNMTPVEQKVDENSGLKFLLVLAIIFAIVIILLPIL